MTRRGPLASLTSVTSLVLCLAVVAGCGDGGEGGRGVDGASIVALDPARLPPAVVDLRVSVEDVGTRLGEAEDSYVEALTMFSLRRGELLVATLQVSRLSSKARDDLAFRRAFVDSLGGTQAREVRLGTTRTWLTTGTNQRLAVWFEGRELFVLSVRADYEQPRVLLRRLLELA